MQIIVILTGIFISICSIIFGITYIICWKNANYSIECICDKIYRVYGYNKKHHEEFNVTFTYNNKEYKEKVLSNYTIRSLKKIFGIDINKDPDFSNKCNLMYWNINPPIKITMYINPKDPKDIFCNRKFPIASIISIVFGILMLITTIKIIAFIYFNIPFI